MHVLLPSETQIREFDPKLLLACALAERGIFSVVGSRIEMHSLIDRLPRGLYLAKDVRHSSARIFRIIERLGYRIAALDEEGLITLPPEGYYAQRVTPSVLAKVALFLAWGERHRAKILAAPGRKAEVVATGNPRFDLLRPELRAFYAAEADVLRRKYGRFVLVNSNFGRANPAVRPREIERPAALTEGERQIQTFFGFRDRLFPYFAEAVPRLAAALPETRIVLRPHPAENFQYWHKLCADAPNVEVVHEGYIAPWLLAADVVIHNGCTTGVEAAVLQRPCISFRPIEADGIEITLPNEVSSEVRDLDGLVEAVAAITRNKPPPHDATAARAIMAPHISGLTHELASDRIAGAILAAVGGLHARPPLATRLQARGQAAVRRWEKQVKSLIPGHKNSRVYTRQRFPGVSLEEAREKIGRFRDILDRFQHVEVRQLSPHLYEVGPATG